MIMARKIEAPKPLLMTEEYWANTYFSVARYTGGITYNGHNYIIVDKQGRDLYECTRIAEKEGRTKAIEAGEPCDLIWDKLQPAYRRLGRETIIRLLNEGKGYEEIKNYKI